MSAVLDTHTVLWYLENSQELSAVARTTIEEAIRLARDVYLSAISKRSTWSRGVSCHQVPCSGCAQL